MENLKQVKKATAKQRKRIYWISLLLVFTFIELVNFAYEVVVRPKTSIFVLLFAVGFGVIAFLIYKKFKKNEADTPEYGDEAAQFLKEQVDRYTKRTINMVAILIATTVLFLLTEVSFYITGNSKMAEVIENVFANLIFVEIPIYLILKDIFCLKMYLRRAKLADDGEKNRKKHIIGMAIYSGIYWLAILILVFAFRDKIHYPVNTFIMSGVFFSITLLFYNLKLRKRITYQNIVINRPRIAVFASVIVVSLGFIVMQRDTWYTQTYINSVPVVQHNNNKIEYNDKTGTYTITSENDDFKILHLTDIHLGGSLYSYRKDLKALEACYAEIEYTKPDLVVVTGDMNFPLGIMSMSLNNTSSVQQFAAFMRNTTVPWCFTYGNHDTESLASASKSELNEVYKSLSYKTSGTLLYPYVQPDITGRNNQVIEVRNSDGTLNTALFLIDSNAYTGEGINVYDYIHDDQVDWYASEVERLNKEEGKTVSSMAFFHIPLQQYRTAYELYEKGSDEVTYFFGENGEKMINKVCCSDYPSKLFDKMLELGSTTGVFCGHDHYNNMSLEYKGIRLTYGMSIDYLAMPGIENDTKQRGAELITLHKDSSWEVKQLPLTEITNSGK